MEGKSLSLKRSKLLYLDILRCAATYMVIALHCVSGYIQAPSLYGTRSWWACLAVNSVARAGVPLFFMISGFLNLSDQRSLEIGGFYRRRLKRVLIPFLFWDAVYFLIGCYSGQTRASLGRFLSELLVQGSKYHLWFVYEMAAIYLLTPFLKRLVDQLTVPQLWLLESIILLPTSILPMVNTLLPVYIAPLRPLLEGYLGYYLLGYILRRGDISSAGRYAAYLCALAGLGLGIWGNARSASPASMNLAMNGGYCLVHYMVAVGIFLLVRQMGLRPLPAFAARGFEAVSRCSYGIYLVHVLVLEQAAYHLERAGFGLTPARTMLCLFLVASLGATALSFLFSRVPGLRRLI